MAKEVKSTVTKRGKEAKFADKAKLVEFLTQIRETGTARLAGDVSYHQLRKLAAEGYLDRKPAEEKKERGRRQVQFVVSSKGNSLIGAYKGLAAAKAKRAAKKQSAVVETMETAE